MPINPKNFHNTIVDKITDHLMEMIIKGNLKPGERLIEQELQKKFNTSRSPIRESFRILAEKGLVFNIQRRGTYVRTISVKDIKDNFPITAYLEGLAARLAIPNLTNKDIEKMEFYLSKMNEAAEQVDVKNYIKYHYKFNDTFIGATRNDLLIGILERLRYQVVWSQFHKFFITEFKDYVLGIHSEMLRLFKEKEVDQLEALTKEHVFFTFNNFIERVDLNGDKEANKTAGE